MKRGGRTIGRWRNGKLEEEEVEAGEVGEAKRGRRWWRKKRRRRRGGEICSGRALVGGGQKRRARREGW